MEYWKNKSLENLKEVIDGIEYIEEWRDVVGYEGMYMVSNLGRLKSYPKTIYISDIIGWYKRKEKILSQRSDKTRGYLKVTLQVDKNRHDTTIHQLVAQAFIPNPDKKPQVNHKKGNKKDNRASQIEWNTAKENSNHAISIGIDSVVGTHNGRCLLTEDTVREIRKEFYGKGRGIIEKLSMKYNISRSKISRIVHNESWTHLK